MGTTLSVKGHIYQDSNTGNKDVHPAGVLPLVAVHSASWRLPAATPARLALLGGASSISILSASRAPASFVLDFLLADANC